MRISKIISCCTAMSLMFSAIPVFKTANAIYQASDILINEVCTQNKVCLIDSYGESSDWIELYNPTDKAVSLAGYSLSKDPSKPKIWKFPDTASIGAGEYLVVIASKNPSLNDEYHTGFNLNKNGETITLSRPDGSIVHELVVPTLGEDCTYEITYTGETEIMKPTPFKENDITVSEPVFSDNSGFYSSKFELELSASNGNEIYYTTDGSDPTTSKTAKVYSSSITVKDCSDEPDIYRAYDEKQGNPQSICSEMNYKKPENPVDKAMVVRAAAKNADGVFSKTVQQTYFITDGKLADYSDTMVISLVTDPDNLFDADKGIYVVGNKWNWTENPWNVDTDPDTMRNFHGKGKEWEREANITIFDKGENIVEQNMGIRIKGASTRNNILKSFNLYARSNYGASKINYPFFPDNIDYNGNIISEYDSLTLRSSSDQRFRDVICHELIKDRNITTTAMRPCVLFINGEYWGFYELTEKFSDDFIKSHYGIPSSDVAMIKNWELEEGTEDDFEEFSRLMDEYASLDLSDNNNYAQACEHFDIDSLIEHYAIGLYFGVWDWPDYNYGAWKSKSTANADNPYSDGKWRFISYDFDFSIGHSYESSVQDMKLYSYDFFQKMDENKNGCITALFVSMLDNSDFRNKFVKTFKEYANKIAKAETAVNLVDKLEKECGDSLVNTNLSLCGDVSEAEKEIHSSLFDNAREYLTNRATYALPQMYSYLGIEPIDDDYNVETIQGDVNMDGKFNVADVVLLQKWLLAVPNTHIPDWKAADLCEDERLDVFDFVMMKRALLKTNLTEWKVIDMGITEYNFISDTDIDVTVNKTGEETWWAQVYLPCCLEAGATYEIQYTIKADANHTYNACIQKNSRDYDTYYFNEMTATTKAQTVKDMFTVEQDCPDAKIGFNLGYESGFYQISDVRLIKIQ